MSLPSPTRALEDLRHAIETLQSHDSDQPAADRHAVCEAAARFLVTTAVAPDATIYELRNRIVDLEGDRPRRCQRCLDIGKPDPQPASICQGHFAIYEDGYVTAQQELDRVQAAAQRAGAPMSPTDNEIVAAALLCDLKALLARSEHDRRFGPAACRQACLDRIKVALQEAVSLAQAALARSTHPFTPSASDDSICGECGGWPTDPHELQAAAVSPAPPVEAGIALIAAERERQQSVEGWTPLHDDTHRRGELARAAACYALQHTTVSGRAIRWPWARADFKPHDPIRNLVKAGALIAAEIDRLARLRGGPPQ